MNRCPICKAPLEFKDYSSENYEEYFEICKQGCKQYGFEAWCGNYKTSLGITELYSHYADSKTRRKKRHFVYKRKLARLRKAYRKGKLK